MSTGYHNANVSIRMRRLDVFLFQARDNKHPTPRSRYRLFLRQIPPMCFHSRNDPIGVKIDPPRQFHSYLSSEIFNELVAILIIGIRFGASLGDVMRQFGHRIPPHARFGTGFPTNCLDHVMKGVQVG